MSTDVKFESAMSKTIHNLCDCCNAEDRVLMLEYPTTKFYKQPFSERKLTSKHHNLWMCRNCWNKLLNALENPSNEFECGKFARE